MAINATFKKYFKKIHFYCKITHNAFYVLQTSYKKYIYVESITLCTKCL